MCKCTHFAFLGIKLHTYTYTSHNHNTYMYTRSQAQAPLHVCVSTPHYTYTNASYVGTHMLTCVHTHKVFDYEL